jgi:hypothetical protein
MHKQWQELMRRHNRLVLVAPRRLQLGLDGLQERAQALMRALWELGRDPNHLIKIVCQSDPKATKRLKWLRKQLATNAILHSVFPHLKLTNVDEANKHQITIEGREISSVDPSIEAMGITGSASGDRATILIADDVVDRRNAITQPGIRQQIKDCWDDWVNLLPDEGIIWYICTLWHNAALTQDLLENPVWAVAWYEVTMPDLGCLVKLPDGTRYRSESTQLWGWDHECKMHPAPDSPLPPPTEQNPDPRAMCTCGKWTKPALLRRRKELGKRKFERGFGNKPMHAGEMIIDPNWIHYYSGEPGDDWIWYISVDTAESQEKHAAWTGVTIGAVDPTTCHLWIWDGYHFKMSAPDKKAYLKRLCGEIRPEGLLIERAGGGITLIELLAEETGIPLIPIPTKLGGLSSKDQWLEAASNRVRTGQVKFAGELHSIRGSLPSPERGDPLEEITDPMSKLKDIRDSFSKLSRWTALMHPVPEEYRNEENDNAADETMSEPALPHRERADESCCKVTVY